MTTATVHTDTYFIRGSSVGSEQLGVAGGHQVVKCSGGYWVYECSFLDYPIVKRNIVIRWTVSQALNFPLALGDQFLILRTDVRTGNKLLQSDEYRGSIDQRQCRNPLPHLRFALILQVCVPIAI